MLPEAVRRAVRLERDVLLLELSGEQLGVGVRSGRRLRPIVTVALGGAERAVAERSLEAVLARIDAADYRVVLALDAAQALRRHLVLPRAVEPELAEVLELEIERHTPFRAEQVYFFYRADRMAAGEKSLAVTLVVVPRQAVDPLIERLETHGLAPEAVTLSGERLKPGAAARRLTAAPSRVWQGAGGRWLRWMAGLALALAVAAAASPLLRLKWAAGDLAVAVDNARREADATLALQGEMRQLASGLRVVAEAKAIAPSPLRVLDDLSRLLPDDSWLARLDVAAGAVTVEGSTADSAALVRRIEASPRFGPVSYLSPVARDPGGAFETFNLSIEIRAP
jgi:general secretion pathway protein L